MMHNGQLPVRLLNLTFIRILLHTQDLVVVFPLALLEFELGVAYFFCNTWLGRIVLGDILEFSHRFFPVARLAEGLGFGLSRFGV